MITHRFSSPRLLAFALLSMMLLVDLGFSNSAVAAVDTFEFATPEQQERFRTMSDEFRCPMCQNTSLTGSNGGVAEDLRREIYLMIMDGKTDSEIEQFMFERYGDFVVYKPPVNTKTYFLWFAPLLVLIISLLYLFRSTRENKEKIVHASSDLDRAKKLLK